MSGCLDLNDGAPAGGASIPDGTADLDMLLWDLASTMWVINARGAINHFGTEVVLAAGAEPESIRAARTVSTPTIAAGCGGCNNFGNESLASHGIQGANTEYASILGGLNNLIADNCDHGVICGGQNNDLLTTSGSSFIGAGNGNQIEANSRSFIGCGSNNDIRRASGSSADNGIVCGVSNDIDIASEAFIGGGRLNLIGVSLDSSNGVICGGQGNRLNRGTHSCIGGGEANQCGGGGVAVNYCTIVGGRNNAVDGDYSTAMGRDSDVNHSGVTMVSDGTTGGTTKASLETDQFISWKTNGRVMANPAMTSGRELYEKQAQGSGSGAGAQVDFTVGALTADGSVLNVDFEVTATRTDGTAGADALAADGHVRARRQGGTVTIFGNTINTDSAGTGVNATVTAVVSGNNLIVRFTIDPGNAEDWNVIADWRRRTVS